MDASPLARPLAELRNHIAELVLVQPGAFRISFTDKRFDTVDSRFTLEADSNVLSGATGRQRRALTRVCRQLHRETSLIFWAANTFIADLHPRSGHHFWKNLEAGVRAYRLPRFCTLKATYHVSAIASCIYAVESEQKEFYDTSVQRLLQGIDYLATEFEIISTFECTNGRGRKENVAVIFTSSGIVASCRLGVQSLLDIRPAHSVLPCEIDIFADMLAKWSRWADQDIPGMLN